jgi:hypothetical protein
VALEKIDFFVPPLTPGCDVLEWIREAALRRISDQDLLNLISMARGEELSRPRQARAFVSQFKYSCLLDMYSRRLGFASFGDSISWYVSCGYDRGWYVDCDDFQDAA